VKYCQLLSFEPGGDVTDVVMISIAERAYREYGFRGLVDWNHQVEAMEHKDVVYPAAFGIRAKVPSARFALFADARHLPADTSELAIFNYLHVYNTNRRKNYPYAYLTKLVDTLLIDDALDLKRRSEGPCMRPYDEFIVAGDGNVYLCGLRFKDAIAGNIFDMDLGDIVAQFGLLREQVAGRAMTDDAPESCRECPMRLPIPTDYERGITIWNAQQHRRLTDTHREPAKPVVIIDGWEVPDFRLREHVAWNEDRYSEHTTSVIMLVDRKIKLGTCKVPYCSVVPMPGRFRNPAARLNMGLRMGFAAGSGLPVIKTTADTALPAEFYGRVQRLARGEVLLPRNLRAESYNTRESKFDVGVAFGETIALRWPPGYRYSKNVPAAEVESDFIKMLENTDMTIDNDCFVYRMARKPQGKI
jgi:hypothetical protein